MPKSLAVACLLALVLCAGAQAKTATLSPSNLPGAPWRAEECRYQMLNGRAGFTDHEVQAEIACAVAHWPVDGGFERALCYASHESGFNEFAANPYSSAKGVYQTVDGTWDGIWRTQPSIRERWGLHMNPGRYGVFNARTAVVLVIRRVSAVGWSSWADFARYGC